MKLGSTLFLRLVVVTLGLVVLTLCGLLCIPLFRGVTGAYAPILVALFIAAVPFFVALFQTMKLLDYIDRNEAFSELSVAALRTIKLCGVAIATWFALISPYVYYAAQLDDAPGVVAINLIFIGGATVVAVFAAVLQKLLQNAIDIKHENDLTV